MCGIAGIHFKKPGAINGHQLERFVDNLLLGIEHRGTDATGIVSVAPGGQRVMLSKEAVKASDFIKIRPSLGDGPIRTVLLHTRFATQGHQSNNANNHPVLNGTTFVTHNGHISNDDELFKENDLTRLGEVDSEIIAAMINDKGFDKVHLALQELQGGFAIAVVDPIAYPDQLILAKGYSSPLIFFQNDDFMVWASTLDAITEAWGDSFGTPPRQRKFGAFKEGQILMVDGAHTEVLEFKPAEKKYTTYNGSAYYGNYDRYNALSTDEKNALCFCGCRRFWHNGPDYDGKCKNQVEGKDCSCEDYIRDIITMPVIPASGGGVDLTCDACGQLDDANVMHYVTDTYLMCSSCWALYDEVEDGVFLPKTCETPVTTLSVVRDAKNEKVREAWKPLAEGDALIRHQHILKKASEATGHNPEFIEWVLFRSELDTLDADPWLQVAHETCDEAYSSAEEELDAVEEAVSKEIVTVIH